MPTTAAPMTNDAVLSLAREFEAGYLAGDRDRAAATLAPDAVHRYLVGGELHELRGPDAIVGEIADHIAQCDESQIVRSDAQLAGDMPVVANRVRVRKGAEWLVVDFTHVLQIAGGRVTAIDEVCTGFRPEA
jgi:hypothetical protein